jgi:hypothetical protein
MASQYALPVAFVKRVVYRARMTQLPLAFEALWPCYRYKDGIGVWRCHRCLWPVPCGCVAEHQRDATPEKRR